MRPLLLLVLVACGSSQPAPTAAPPPRREAPAPGDPEEAERLRRAELAKAHHKLEAQHSEALAATCAVPKAPAQPRCLPSCYTTEAADPRADTLQKALVEIGHLVCERDGTYLVVDELGGALPYRSGKRPPRAARKGSWQAEVVKALAMKDPVAITGPWRDVTHPLTKEKLRCVSASRFVKRVPGTLGPCGGLGTCEASGSASARAINVVHYRLAEAKRLAAAGKQDDCLKAALEAVAVARGLPRWRQYMSLNAGVWKVQVYRTRFDGVLDEDALFARTAALGSEAEAVYTACGGGPPATTVEQEQSFHTCW